MTNGLRCLTLHEPWATLIAVGAKRIETRSWSTSFRGPIGIHAGSHLREEYMSLAKTSPFNEFLHQDTPYYQGCIIAVGYLSACFPIKATSHYILLNGRNVRVTDTERSFGDFTPGRFGWLIENVQRVVPPYPVRGHQGLWSLDRPNDLLQEAMADAHLQSARV